MSTSIEFVDWITTTFAAGILISARVLPIFFFLPGLGESTVPMRVKVGLGLCFSIVLLNSDLSFDTSYIAKFFLMAFFCEIGTGLIIGLLMRLFMFAIQTTGTIAAQSTSLSQILGSAGVDPMPAIGHILVVSAVCLALTSGLHLKVLSFLIHSYNVIPFGIWLSGQNVAAWGLQQVSSVFRLAFTLAAPFILLSLLYNIVLGVINKAMPQLMVAFVGAPFITFGGLFVLFLSAPIILLSWLSVFSRFLENPVG